MADVVAEFRKWVSTDARASALWNKIDRNTANYKDAAEYSSIVGRQFERLIRQNYESVEDLGYDYSDIRSALEKCYAESAYYSKSVLGSQNRRSGINMRPIEPRIEQSRVDNLLDLAREAGTIEPIVSNGQLQNIAKTAISDTINANARFQEEAGLKTTITRHAVAGCCKWCDGIGAGFTPGVAYSYDERPDDIFQFHENCDCWVEYKASKLYKKAVNNRNIRTVQF